jgi:hypothetical protein
MDGSLFIEITFLFYQWNNTGDDEGEETLLEFLDNEVIVSWSTLYFWCCYHGYVFHLQDLLLAWWNSKIWLQLNRVTFKAALCYRL